MSMTFSVCTKQTHPLFPEGVWTMPPALEAVSAAHDAALDAYYEADDNSGLDCPAPPPGLPVNLANRNAREVMSALGLSHTRDVEADIYTVDVQVFRSAAVRFLRASMDRPSPALASSETLGAGGARFIQGGRAAGYLQQTVRRILDHVQAALEHVSEGQAVKMVVG